MELYETPLFTSEKGPLYLRLYKSIAAQITRGQLHAEQKLPSKRALAAQLGLSVNTVDGAYQMLVAEGYIEARPKSGFYVCRIAKMPEPPSPMPAAPAPAPQAQNWLYDFRTSGVDPSLFPYKTWARIQREILTEHPDYLNLGERGGDLSLRSAIADYLHEYRGVRCTAEQIVVGAGIEYLVGLLAGLFRDRLFALEDPGYGRIYRVLQNNCIPSVFLPVDQNGLEVDRLDDCAASVVYVTPSHQFPTGAILPMQRRQALLNWAAAMPGRYIIEDDYDSEFRFDTRPIPALQGLDSCGRVIYISTFSRIIAPSIRIAYMVLPPSLEEAFRQRYSVYSPTVSRFEQNTLRRFIQSGAFYRHLNRVRVAYRARRDLLVELLSGMAVQRGVTVTGAHTGLHLIAQVRGELSEQALVQAAAEQGVHLRGLSEYCLGDKSGLPASSVVLGYSSLAEQALREACALLQKAWSAPR